MTLGSLTKRFRIDDPDKFRLSDYDPDDSGGLYAQGGKILSLLSHQIPGMRRKRVARQ